MKRKYILQIAVLILAMTTVSMPPEANGGSSTPTKQKAVETPFLGRWVMHIYLRDKNGNPKLFEDQVEIKQDAKGVLSGSLEVPKAFTAKLEKIEISNRHFSFEIQADEGRGSFRVRYEGDLHSEDDRTFVGYGTVLTPQRILLGGFVGQKL